jgi:two-component system, OmpR family, response regulator VicR
VKVLIVEDDRDIVEAISLAFQIRWPEASVSSTQLGERGVELVEKESPDIVILDLGLPDISGYEVLKQIRLFSSIPVIILTARSEESDIVKGLELGADDYIVKPFKQLELLSRVQVQLRKQDVMGEGKPLVCGMLRFEPIARKFRYGRKEVKLTATESQILFKLMKNAGRVVSRKDVAEDVWGVDDPSAIESLSVHMRRLREKIEKDPSHPRLIINKEGRGYSLIKPRLIDSFLLLWFGVFSCYIFVMMWRGVYWYHEPNRAILITETTLGGLILLYGLYRIKRAVFVKLS